MEKSTSDELSINVSIKDTWIFSRLLELYGKVLTDERISKEIREEYFHQFNYSFEHAKTEE